jgi:hypothetical protein
MLTIINALLFILVNYNVNTNVAITANFILSIASIIRVFILFNKLILKKEADILIVVNYILFDSCIIVGYTNGLEFHVSFYIFAFFTIFIGLYYHYYKKCLLNML